MENLSKGGARLADVQKQLEGYFLSPEHARGDVVVNKVFLSVGTNDIRDCREKGVRGLKAVLLHVVEQVKLMFPDAMVWIQSLVPLPWQHKYTFQNVQEFNSVIYEVCKHTQSFYLDIFHDFLAFDLRHGCMLRRESLFVDGKNIHLNRFGMGRLARRYIELIHGTFNPCGY